MSINSYDFYSLKKNSTKLIYDSHISNEREKMHTYIYISFSTVFFTLNNLSIMFEIIKILMLNIIRNINQIEIIEFYSNIVYFYLIQWKKSKINVIMINKKQKYKNRFYYCSLSSSITIVKFHQ